MSGKSFVQEVWTKQGARFVARWNAYVLENGERHRVQCGPYELGRKVSHGPGLKSLSYARKAWSRVYWSVFTEHHPTTIAAPKPNFGGADATSDTPVKDFISLVWEPSRCGGSDDNSRINWEYYPDSFLIPFFGESTLAEMNDVNLIKSFMSGIADRKLSEWTAKKAFTYVKAILDIARDLGMTKGNASRLIPKNRRIPKGIKKSKA